MSEISDNTIELVGNDYPFFKYVSGESGGLTVHYNAVGPGQAFKAVLENTPFQANEFSLANYTLMRDRGVDWMTAIPVFLNRAFRHGSIFVRRDSDLTHPSHLRGKTIGAREYTQTAGVWWRGLMLEEYDLHWTDLKWVAGSSRRFAPPAEAAVQTVEDDPEQLVIDGKIDAFLVPSTNDSKRPEGEQLLRPLMPDTEAAERDYFARTGIFPLNHAVVLHKTVLEKFPEAPQALFKAYCASKKQFYDEGGRVNPWGDETNDDLIPFGFTVKNREIVEKLFGYLHEQKFISRIPDIEPIFADGAMNFLDA